MLVISVIMDQLLLLTLINYVLLDSSVQHIILLNAQKLTVLSVMHVVIMLVNKLIAACGHSDVQIIISDSLKEQLKNQIVLSVLMDIIAYQDQTLNRFVQEDFIAYQEVLLKQLLVLKEVQTHWKDNIN